jgi:pimeloyl-ACP methyl ester carboxylesterase
VDDTKRVSVNGIEMAYSEAGSGGRPFVLVHGFTGSRDDFREPLPALAPLGWTVTPDLRGHGDSTNTRDAGSYTLDRLVGDLVGFLDAIGIERCDLLGHSMGGMVALRLVLEHPARVASLVCMDTSPGAVKGIKREVWQAGAVVARTAGMERLFELMRAGAERDPLRAPASRRLEEREGPESYWGRIRRKVLAMDPEAFASLGPELLDQAGVAGRLGEIRCPTLVLVGAEDAPFLGAADTLERGIPGARRVTIPDAAHSPQAENPDAWLAAVREHLMRVR